MGTIQEPGEKHGGFLVDRRSAAATRPAGLRTVGSDRDDHPLLQNAAFVTLFLSTTCISPLLPSKVPSALRGQEALGISQPRSLTPIL